MYSNGAYVKEPLIAKIGQKISLTLRYICLILLGVFCILHPIGALTWVGVALIATSASCVVGVASGRYRWEWVALSPLVASLLVGTVVVWPVSAGISIMLMLALVATLTDRLIHLSVVASMLRKLPGEPQER